MTTRRMLLYNATVSCLISHFSFVHLPMATIAASLIFYMTQLCDVAFNRNDTFPTLFSQFFCCNFRIFLYLFFNPIIKRFFLSISLSISLSIILSIILRLINALVLLKSLLIGNGSKKKTIHLNGLLGNLFDLLPYKNTAIPE